MNRRLGVLLAIAVVVLVASVAMRHLIGAPAVDESTVPLSRPVATPSTVITTTTTIVVSPRDPFQPLVDETPPTTVAPTPPTP